MGLPEIPEAPKDITVKGFFMEWLPEQFKAFAEIVKQAGADISAGMSFRIAGDAGGDFTTAIDKGEFKVSEGLADDAIATLIMSDKNFIQVVTGERKMAMQPPGGGVPSPEEIPERLQTTIDTLKGVEGMLAFKVTDEKEGDFEVKVKFAGAMKDEPDVSITVAKEDADAMASGELNPQAAFMGGKIQIDGDMGILMQMMPLMMQ